MVRKSFYLRNNSRNLILSDSLLKKFSTLSFDVLSVPGARPSDLWDFLPPYSKFEKVVLFVGGNALESFESKSGNFRCAQEPSEVANQVFDLAHALSIRATEVFVVGVPPRGSEDLQAKVLQLNAELNSRQNKRIVFVGISHYLYNLKHISKDLCHFKKRAFSKIHKLLNEKILKQKFRKDSSLNKKYPPIIEYSSYPF